MGLAIFVHHAADHAIARDLENAGVASVSAQFGLDDFFLRTSACRVLQLV